jgi:predicted metal-binding membrane protein
MWWSMMVAMMAPSAAPMVLLYARVARTGGGAGPQPALGRTGWFVAGYLSVWLGFSIAATLLQSGFERLAWLSPARMSAQSRGFAGGLLLAAGLYQLSPVRDFCLQRCRAPGQFLSRHYRPGAAGALRIGLAHGAYCLACCGLLMALLFVGGVMNLVWIAALTVLVAAEKLLPGGRWIGRIAGAGLVAAGLLMLVSPALR